MSENSEFKSYRGVYISSQVQRVVFTLFNELYSQNPRPKMKDIFYEIFKKTKVPEKSARRIIKRGIKSPKKTKSRKILNYNQNDFKVLDNIINKLYIEDEINPSKNDVYLKLKSEPKNELSFKKSKEVHFINY